MFIVIATSGDEVPASVRAMADTVVIGGIVVKNRTGVTV